MPEVNVQNIIAGVGNLFVDGQNVGATEGDVQLVTVPTELIIDNTAQFPGVELGRKTLANAYFLRFTELEATEENIAKVLGLGAPRTVGGKKRIYGGSSPVSAYRINHTIEIYGAGPYGGTRKFYGWKAIYVEQAEMPLFTAKDMVKIPVTVKLLPDMGRPGTENTWYIEEDIINQPPA